MKCGTRWLTLGVSLLIFSFDLGAAEKRHHDAHVHGVAEINIAVEGAKATVEFRAPAESLMGFEHEAKSESDKKKRDAALEQLRTKKDQMVVFDPKLDCKSSDIKTTIVEEKGGTTRKRNPARTRTKIKRRVVSIAKSVGLSWSHAISPLPAAVSGSAFPKSFGRSRKLMFRWSAIQDNPARRSRKTKET